MLKNIFANFIGRLWGTLSNFLFIPVYIHYLGFDSYSVISFTLVVAGLMSVLDAGVTATLSRELARKDKCELDRLKVFKTLEYIYFLIVIFVIFCLFVFSDYISENWLNEQSFSTLDVSHLLKIISFDIAFQLLFRFYLGGMFGLEEQIKANFYQVGWGMLRNGLVIISIYIMPTLEMFFAWQAISSIIFSLLARASLKKILFVNYSSNAFKFDIHILSNVWRFTGGMFLIALVAGINSQLDKLVISILLPVETLGYYTLCVSLSLGLVILVSPFSTALLPKLTALYSTRNTEEASNLYNAIVLFVSIVIFTFMSNMIFNAETIIWVWTGDAQLASKAALYLPLTMISYAMLALAVLPFTIAVANGYTKINTFLGILSLLVTIPGYWLGATYYGALGAAFVYCITQTIVTLIYFYFIDKRFIKGGNIFNFYLIRITFPLLLAILFGYCFTYIAAFDSASRMLSLLQIFIQLLMSTLLTLAVCMPSFLFGFIANAKFKVRAIFGNLKK